MEIVVAVLMAFGPSDAPASGGAVGLTATQAASDSFQSQSQSDRLRDAAPAVKTSVAYRESACIDS
ncbi:hypothetical protein [Streptomyces mayteni]